MATKIHKVIVDVINEDGEMGLYGRIYVKEHVAAVTASYPYAMHLAEKLDGYCDGVRVEGPDVPAPVASFDEIPF